ncbi:MAG: PQQ-binding-like beta-propeller repeat protein, partial [Planctomycetales bacterium]|nr:PQQ-binding-like beta-propeller repeat protein [Planctomycetales bacterium]
MAISGTARAPLPSSVVALSLLALLGAPGPGAGAQDRPKTELDNACHVVELMSEGRKLLAEAETALSVGKVRPAVERLLALSRRHGNELIASPRADAWQAHYRSAAEEVARRLADLPADLRGSVADLLDGPAAAETAEALAAGDPERLEEVAVRWPDSAAAPEALALGGDLWLERGAAGAAAWAYRAALAARGDAPGPDDSPLVLRLVRSLALSGRGAEIRTLAERLATSAPGLRLPGPAGPVPASGALLATAERLAGDPTFEWPEPDPTPAPGLDPPSLGRPLLPAAVIQLFGSQGERASTVGDTVPTLPVAAAGRVVVHRGTRLDAYDLDTLQLRWSGPTGEAGDTSARGTPRAPVPGASVCGGLVAAVVSSARPGRRGGGYGLPVAPLRNVGSTELVVHDARTGTLEASITAAEATEAAQRAGLRGDDPLEFASVPVLRGSRITVGARRESQNQQQESWVLGFVLGARTREEPRTPGPRPGEGRMRRPWRLAFQTFVCSQGGGGGPRGLGGPAPGPTVADGGDILVAVTHAGAVAGIHPVTGGLRWLLRYRHSGGDSPASELFLPGRAVFSGQEVIVGPADSDTVYALDRRTGDLLWKRPSGDDDPDGLAGGLVPRAPPSRLGPWREILGVRGGRVFLRRDQAIEALRLARGTFENRFDPSLSDSGGAPVAGRPVFGAGGLAIAGGRKLVVLGPNLVEHLGEVELDSIPAPGHDQGGCGSKLAGALLRVD